MYTKWKQPLDKVLSVPLGQIDNPKCNIAFRWLLSFCSACLLCSVLLLSYGCDSWLASINIILMSYWNRGNSIPKSLSSQNYEQLLQPQHLLSNSGSLKPAMKFDSSSDFYFVGKYYFVRMLVLFYQQKGSNPACFLFSVLPFYILSIIILFHIVFLSKKVSC